MEYERVVQVRLYPDDGGAPFVGSGYLVAPRLVLTAAHVLGDGAERPDAGRVTVQASVSVLGGVPSRAEVSAAVVWYRRTTAVDAALLELESHSDSDASSESGSDSGSRPESDAPFVQRWGFLIGSRPCSVSLTGFPRMQRDGATGPRSARQLDGHITAGNQAADGRFEIASSDPTRPLAADAAGSTGSATATRWSGMSGAAVVAADSDGDLVCGVVRHDLQADGGTILTATPVRTLLADEDFVEVLTAHRAGVRTEPVEAARLLAPVTSPAVSGSPTGLLRADVEAVAFTGRERELEALLSWCRGGATGLSARVLAGPSGQGKSRLARQLTLLMEREGWVSGHLRAEVTDFELPEGFPGFEALRTELPLLVVVDYAETRPNRVRALLSQLSNTRQRVRVLLLARSDGPWRTEAHNATARVRDVLNLAEVTELSALYGASGAGSAAVGTAGPEPEGLVRLRRKAFGDAARGLAAMLPLVPGLIEADWAAVAAALPAPADLADARYENVLTLQLAALTGLLQHGPTPVPATASASAEKILLDHEKRFWAGSAASPAFHLDVLPTATLDAAVAAAVLCGAANHAEAVHVLGAVTGLTAQQIPSVAAWIAQLYPAAPGRLWASLQPDRVGEYHAAAVLTAPVKTLDTARLLTDAAPGQQAQFVTVLARAAIGAYNAGRSGDSERIVAVVTDAVEGTSLRRAAMRAIGDALPYPNRVINPIAVLISRLFVEAEIRLAELNPGGDESDLATSLANLGVLLSESGQRLEGLAATRQSVTIRRRLAEDDPTQDADLASVLSNLGAHLSEAGQRQAALAAAEEAVTIYRRLAAHDPTHEPRLAAALSNLGSHLSQTGWRHEALAAAEEAVEIRRRLTEGDPAADEADLAAGLSNLGTNLAIAGRRREALTATEQAVEIYRRLAAGDRAAHEPELAAVLFNLGLRMSQVGRHAEALAAAEEGVGIQRRLTADNPAAHEPGLARCLSGLGTILSQVGRPTEALAAEQESVQIRRRLTAEDPAAHEPGLAHSLSNLRVRLSQAGRPTEALAAGQEAVQIRRRLTAEDPLAHESGLASSLTSLGNGLAQVDRHAEALTATEEAVAIRRRLAAGNRAAHEPELAASLSDLGSRLSKAGRHGEALVAAQQAVAIRRRLAAEIPPVHEPDLATDLAKLGSRLAEANQFAQALDPMREAVAIRRRLASADPAAHGSDLAFLLSSLGSHLAQAGQFTEAVTAAEEAVEILSRLAADTPFTYLPGLATALFNLGNRLSQTGRFTDALAATEQSLELVRRLVEYAPAAFEHDLAVVLSKLSVRLSRTGSEAEALTTAEEAVEIYRRLDPAAHEGSLATALSTLAGHMSKAGRLPEALAAEQEAIDIRRRLAANNPTAHEADLAGSLSDLSVRLSKAGRPAEALTAQQEAVEIRRRLAAANPATHEPRFAKSLTSLGSHLAKADRPADALTVMEEAVEIYRRLAAHDRATYGPDLAISLTLTVALWVYQDPSKALAASEEAEALLRKYIPAAPSLTTLLDGVLEAQVQIRKLIP